MMNVQPHTNERGVVSIFIVIFTALLVTIITTSFVQIMLRNQQQASNNDLSQSAYDSAMAGVEDAKRALVRLKQCEKLSSPLPGDCDDIRTALVTNGYKCNSLDGTSSLANFANGEVQVGDVSLNQAYTCVTVQVKTDSYKGETTSGEPVVIPLVPDGDPNLIKAVRISWYTNEDLPKELAPTGQPKYTVAAPQILPVELLAFDQWPANAPPIMRSQLIQFNGDSPINLDNFTNPAGTNNATTRFLYPAPEVLGLTQSFDDDKRREPGSRNAVSLASCRNSFTYAGYACSTIVSLPPNPGGTLEAYLQLAGIYNKTTMHYKVELCNNAAVCAPSNVIKFDNVQPIVDSTGRASDLFRRVQASVGVSQSGTPVQFPDAALTVGKSICKDFFVTNDYYNADANGDGDVCEPGQP